MIVKINLLLIFLPITLVGHNDSKVRKEKQFALNDHIQIYHQLAGNEVELPAIEVFNKAYSGYLSLMKKGAITKELLTIIDFQRSSNEKRLWVIDLNNKTVLWHTLVAHGKNSGEEYARKFSNTSQSYQSSLGFYVTGKTYYGKHGVSLYLNGMEKGINDRARKRYIVMHGAKYVSQAFIRKYGRLGRSFGCPAVPMNFYRDIINKIQDKSCLFIYYPSKEYETNSALINRNS